MITNFFKTFSLVLKSLLSSAVVVFIVVLSLMKYYEPSQLALKDLKETDDGLYLIYKVVNTVNYEERLKHYIYVEVADAKTDYLEIGLNYIQDVNNKRSTPIKVVQIQKSLKGFSTWSESDLQDWTAIWYEKLLVLKVENDFIIEVLTNIKEQASQKDKEQVLFYKYKLTLSELYNFELIEMQ